MVADVSESEEWKEIDESMGRCQIAVYREVDGVEAASWRQMAVRVKMKGNRCINGSMSDSCLLKRMEAARRRQMAVKVEDGRRTMYRWVDVRQLFVGKRRIRERRVKRQSIERQRSGGM